MNTPHLLVGTVYCHRSLCRERGLRKSSYTDLGLSKAEVE